VLIVTSVEISAAGAGRRDPYVDALRVFAICTVVLGHWLVTALTYHGGRIGAPDLLAVLPWAQWLTLLFQVMPMFFLCAGYAAAASWNAQRAGAVPARVWLRRRALRLLIPTSVHITEATLVVGACALAGIAPARLALGAWAVALHLWFLPVYLALLLLTPVMAAAHRRWGLLVPAVMAAAGALVDVLVLSVHVHVIGWANYVLVWGALYQTGIAWRDGASAWDRRWALAVAAVGAAAFACLVGLGPFPLSMIGVTGSTVTNTAPPSAALIAFAAAQTGLLVAAGPAATRWLRRDGVVPGAVRGAVRRINPLVMTVYLWHMVPVVVGGVGLYLTGLMPQPAIGSPRWWALRVVWVAALAVVLVPLVAAQARTERWLGLRLGVGSDRFTGAGAPALIWAGVTLAGYGLYRFAVYGFAPAGRPSPLALGSFSVGVLLVYAETRWAERTAAHRHRRGRDTGLHSSVDIA
jgi:fucose 4-O-acetylase-like acetyltransferase